MKTPSLALVLPFLSTLAPVLGVGNAAALPRHHLEPDSPKFYFQRQIKRAVGEQFVNKSIPRTTTSKPPPPPSTTVTSLVSVPTGQSLEQFLSQLLSTDPESTTHPPNAGYPAFMGHPTTNPTDKVDTTSISAAGPAVYHHPLSTPPSSSIAGTGGILPPVIPSVISHATKVSIPGGGDGSGGISAASSRSGSAVSTPRIYSSSGSDVATTHPSRGKYSLICLYVWAL